MPRRLASLVLAVLAAGGCVAQPPRPGASGAGPDQVPSASSSAGAAPGGEPTTRPSARPATSVGPRPTIPAGVDQVAWWHVDAELDGSRTPIAEHVSAGLLGSPATVTQTIPTADGSVRIWGDGAVIAILVGTDRTSTLAFRDIATGRELRRDTFDTPGVETVLVDPAHRLAYVAIELPGDSQFPIGGLEIRRLDLAGDASRTLITLDRRYPVDSEFGPGDSLAIDPDGILVVEACDNLAGCRLWEVGPDEVDPGPTTLPKGTPHVCATFGASRTRLIVLDVTATGDGATCAGDTMDTPRSMSAIDRRTGASRQIDATHLTDGLVSELDGRTDLIATVRSADWLTTSVISVDVESLARTTHATGLANNPASVGGWLGLPRRTLPAPWVLIEAWGIQSAGDGTVPPARLLNLETDELIELAPGTFGWSS